MFWKKVTALISTPEQNAVCLLCRASRPAIRAHLSTCTVDTAGFCRWGKRDVKLTTYLKLVPRVRISGSMFRLHHTPLRVHKFNFTFIGQWPLWVKIGLTKMGPSFTWIISVPHLNKYNITDLQNIIWELYKVENVYKQRLITFKTDRQ